MSRVGKHMLQACSSCSQTTYPQAFQRRPNTSTPTPTPVGRVESHYELTLEWERGTYASCLPWLPFSITCFRDLQSFACAWSKLVTLICVLIHGRHKHCNFAERKLNWKSWQARGQSTACGKYKEPQLGKIAQQFSANGCFGGKPSVHFQKEIQSSFTDPRPSCASSSHLYLRQQTVKQGGGREQFGNFYQIKNAKKGDEESFWVERWLVQR